MRHPAEFNQVIDDVLKLSELTEKVLGWFSGPHGDAVLSRWKPEVPVSIFYEALPLIFEDIFRQKFKPSENSAGMKFAVAVLKETGFRSKSESDEKIAATVKKALRRISEQPRLDYKGLSATVVRLNRL